MSGVRVELWAVLRRAARICVFRRVSQGGGPVSAHAVLVLALIATAVTVAVEVLDAGSGLSFNPYGLTAQLAGWVILAALFVILGGRRGNLPLTRAIAECAAISSLTGGVFVAVRLGLSGAGDWAQGNDGLLALVEFALAWVALAWALAAILHAGRRLWDVPVRLPGLRLITAAVAPILVIPFQPVVYGSNTIWDRFDVWHLADELRKSLDETPPPGTAARPRFDYEAAFYRQPALVDTAVKRILASEGELPRLYFVGAAASSEHEVFRREVLGAQAVFDQRFDTSGRSTVLINHRETASSVPLATMTNLGRVLEGVGAQMNREKDVLVLFITSHDSKDLLSVSFPGIQLNQITPKALSEALLRSGVRNRVIILSACFAGSFIPELEDSHTIIMTAASADRTSFGCSNDRDWTYFGSALFEHALQSTRSFTEAFSQARTLIESWEKRQGLTPSEPQISAGPEILRVLDEIAANDLAERADLATETRQR